MNDAQIKERLEYLRGEIEAERISYGEIHELQTLKDHIDPDDVLLLQWAGVPEFPEERTWIVSWTTEITAPSAKAAVKQAMDLMREPEENAASFMVKDDDGDTEQVWVSEVNSAVQAG